MEPDDNVGWEISRMSTHHLQPGGSNDAPSSSFNVGSATIRREMYFDVRNDDTAMDNVSDNGSVGQGAPLALTGFDNEDRYSLWKNAEMRLNNHRRGRRGIRRSRSVSPSPPARNVRPRIEEIDERDQGPCPEEELASLMASDSENDHDDAAPGQGMIEEEKSSESSDEEEEIMDAEEEEDMVFEGIERETCRVCRQIGSDPYGKTLSGQIQKKVMQMADDCLEVVNIEQVIHDMVRKNNQHVVQPMRQVGRNVGALSAIDFFKHFGLGPYETHNACRKIPKLEILKSIAIASRVESSLFNQGIRNAVGGQLDNKSLRIMLAFSNAKIRHIMQLQTFKERQAKMESDKRIEGGSEIGGTLFQTQTTMVNASAQLGGVSLSVLCENSVSSSNVYKLTQ